MSESPAPQHSTPASPVDPAASPDGHGQPSSGQAPPSPPPAYDYRPPMPRAPVGDQFARPTGPIGQIRPTGLTMLLFFVTLGIWGLVYYYLAQEEMKRHSGEGLGGPIALLIAIIFGVVSPFILSHEVGGLYERTGRPKPVSALTGLWFFPGILILVGPFIWFVQTNAALNDYWRSLGAR